MREHDDTQAIFREVSEIKSMITNHIAETMAYRRERDKVVDAHSDILWDKDKKPGMVTRFDRIEQDREREKEMRIWWRGAVGVPVIGLFIDWLVRTFHQTH